MLQKEIVDCCTIAQDQQLRGYSLPEARVTVSQVVVKDHHILYRKSKVLRGVPQHSSKSPLHHCCFMWHKVPYIGVIPILQDQLRVANSNNGSVG